MDIRILEVTEKVCRLNDMGEALRLEVGKVCLTVYDTNNKCKHIVSDPFNNTVFFEHGKREVDKYFDAILGELNKKLKELRGY